MWLRHQVTVKPYLGDSAYGRQYGDPVPVRCWLEKKVRLVRAPDGREVTSSATFYCRLGVVEAPPESLVTLDDGRETTVIEQVTQAGGGLPLPDHLEVRLV
jgi:hypothetical protein